jgi:alpha-mannosidase
MKKFCVISHTHWDREWYMPLELFRLRLVDLMDHCLEILRENPDYIFHLDAQTIVLEDYLDFRPGKREELKKYITEGRLMVGPWYLQNDFYLTSGEATVRNLIEGHRLAEEFGHCDKVGYAADQFGNISQLPQILKNFGIDNFVFARGLKPLEPDGEGGARQIDHPTEFLWEGADGTRALAVHMYFWYNNAQRFSADINKAKLLVDQVEKQFEGLAVTPYLLLMNGVDHLEAQEDLLPILEQLNGKLEDGCEIRQYHLLQYVEDVRRYIEENHVDLWVHRGEIRQGGDGELLKGTLSSRSYLKRENVLAQNMLECKLEPLYAMMELGGMSGVTSVDHFRYMWKELMKNHPHDSSCGCSRDEVHRHMEDNYARLRDTADEMLRRGLQAAARHVAVRDGAEEAYYIVVANTVENARCGAVHVTLDFPAAESVEAFEIVDSEGKEARYAVISHRKCVRDLFTPINLPGCLDVDRYEVYLWCDQVPGMGFASYLVKKSEQKPQQPLVLLSHIGGQVLENEKVRLTVSEQGEVAYLNKETGVELQNLLELEDTGDRGDSYCYGDTGEAPIYGSAYPAQVWMEEDNEFCKRCVIRRRLDLPARYDFQKSRRSAETAACTVELELVLWKGSDVPEVHYRVENGVEDHRLRLLVNTALHTDATTADIPFDLVTHTSKDHCFNTQSRVFPNTSFALLQEGKHGVAVFTEGQHEYEHLEERGALAFTLIRCTGVISRGAEYQPTGGDQWVCPENQCLRTVVGRVGVHAYVGDMFHAGIPFMAKSFRNALLPWFDSCNPKKFCGGRTAVQGTGLDEVFYQKDRYEGVTIPASSSLVQIFGEGVAVTAMKKAEQGDGVVVRMVNLREEPSTCTLVAPGEVFESSMMEDRGESLGGEAVLHFRKKEIKTVLIIPEKR